MAIEQTRAQIIANIWQAIAQSGVSLSSVPSEQQQKLVGKIADEMMVTLNSLLDVIQDEAKLSDKDDEQTGSVDELGEKVLWQGRPFLSLIEKYTLTNERLKISYGLVGRQVENFELIRVQDIDFKQNLGERVFGTGDITIRGADPSKSMIVLRNVSKPEDVYEILRRAWLDARKRHGLLFREEM